MRLIDAYTLKNDLITFFPDECLEGITAKTLFKQILTDIDNAPTVPLPNEQIAWEQGYEAGLAQGKHERPQGEWIDHSETDGYVECPFCGSATTCEGNKDELHYCWNCGAKMKGGAE